jgi:signal transduction histidine kinase
MFDANFAATRDVSQRHLGSRAASIGVVMRHTANLLVAIVVLAHHDGTQLSGRLLLGALGLWAIYRLATRSPAAPVTAIDFAFTIAVCLAIPWLVDDPGFYLSNSAPIAVAGTAVISLTVALPLRVSFFATVMIAASYATGAASVIGWPHVSDVFNLYYFALQWGTCALIRMAELRVASAVDTARAQRQNAEVTQRVTTAVREYDREQLRLLHDTVASTLLLVGQGSSLAPDRLAQQARRDLDVLGDPQPESPEPVELVGALRELAVHHHTATRFTGADTLWVSAQIGRCLISVTREALTNVDRHAYASAVTLDIAPHRIVITDDGRGFDATAPRLGYGITHSMTARMLSLGGSVAVTSTSGHGTTTTLTWPNPYLQQVTPSASVVDPDRLIERTRTGYGLSLTAYAVLSLASMAPAAFHATTSATAQIALATSAALITLAAIPYTLGTRDKPGIIPGALLAIALLQTALLPSTAVGGQAQWSQATIGWCVLPFLLREPVRRGAVRLVGVWIIVAAYTFLRSPSEHTAVNLGLGTASILVVQLLALLFSGLIADAAAEAHVELSARTALVATQRIASAVQIEYRHRYAGLLDNVRPLLEAWRDRRPVDQDMRRRARTESRRLRVLFGQSAVFDLAQLRSAIDTADARGVDVSIDVQGTLTRVSDRDAHDIAAPLIKALTVTDSTARVTILTLDDVLMASIVCRDVAEANVLQLGLCVSDDVDVVDIDGTVWVTVRHRLREGEPPYDDDTLQAAVNDLHHR